MTPTFSAKLTAQGANQYDGCCLCGAVRYRIELDARSEGAQWGFSVWECVVAPGKFQLLAGSELLSGHQFAADSAHHFFCELCGTRSFSHHAQGACGEFYSVDLRSLGRQQATVA
ncbi:MAG TPA: hypothetical protein VI299_05950 [Polyangiales bacterium]